MKPENRTFWQHLAATYLNLAAESTKDEQAAYAYQVRAILTMERAQALGTMNSPKENFNLIGIYFNIQQYEKAIELLDAGLRGGKIENDQKNWELLYYSYLQIEQQAIDVLKEATKHFPKVGQLEYLIAQTYNGLNKQEEAIKHLQACIAKGGADKPHMAYLYLAYIGYELKKYDIALDAAKNALKYPDGVKEGTTLKKAIEDALAERDLKKKSM
jgi:tetratricopeptide (TPR) repeat protein